MCRAHVELLAPSHQLLQPVFRWFEKEAASQVVRAAESSEAARGGTGSVEGAGVFFVIAVLYSTLHSHIFDTTTLYFL